MYRFNRIVLLPNVTATNKCNRELLTQKKTASSTQMSLVNKSEVTSLYILATAISLLRVRRWHDINGEGGQRKQTDTEISVCYSMLQLKERVTWCLNSEHLV